MSPISKASSGLYPGQLHLYFDVNRPSSTMAVPTESRITLSGAGHVSLTNSPIDILSTMALVRDPSAGAIVSFAGTSSIASAPLQS